jgi:hypothetical protein
MVLHLKQTDLHCIITGCDFKEQGEILKNGGGFLTHIKSHDKNEKDKLFCDNFYTLASHPELLPELLDDDVDLAPLGESSSSESHSPLDDDEETYSELDRRLEKEKVEKLAAKQTRDTIKRLQKEEAEVAKRIEAVQAEMAEKEVARKGDVDERATIIKTAGEQLIDAVKAVIPYTKPATQEELNTNLLPDFQESLESIKEALKEDIA